MKINTNINTMHTLKNIVLSGTFCLAAFFMEGQNKYALIIGINDYYEAPGIKSVESLDGSVNDANAIRDMLITKFGFKKNNIDTVYNAAATRDNIVASLSKKLQQCKPGDIMVFFYSGHGVWMRNSQLEDDAIKKGRNQAMLTSDLYNYKDHFKCFLRDFTLKTWFNYFVSKKVKLTSIFDCCFGGNLIMAEHGALVYPGKTKGVDFNRLMRRLTYDIDDPEKLMDSISGNTIKAAAGCKTDASGAIFNTLDTDNDGVPDCKDKEVFTDRTCFPVNEDGVGKCDIDYLLQRTLTKFDEAELEKNTGDVVQGEAARERAFSSSTVIDISEKDTIRRPSERLNSGILFLSATTEAQKAREFKDENNVVHGAFTAALIRVINQYPNGITAADLYDKIKADMANAKLKQTPTIIKDPARLNTDLIGQPLKSVRR
ncbi:MAG: caspase family protein [Aquabacterium sp.]|nr:caspase family protein [Ferruginibacter sp.]